MNKQLDLFQTIRVIEKAVSIAYINNLFFRKNSLIYSKLVVEEVRLKGKIAQDKIARDKIV